MKKIVINISFLLCVSTILVAQNNAYAPRFGLQLSPTFSWMGSDNNAINQNGVNLGLKLAMVGEFSFQENYAVTSGIGFAFNHGGTLQYDNRNQENRTYWNTDGSINQAVSLKYSVQYVEIPVGLKMRTREFGYFRYYGEPFLALGFRSQARGDIKKTDIDDVDIKDYVNGLSLSWGIGFGTEYGVSANTALVGGLYFQQQFTNLAKDVYDGYKAKSTFKALTIRLGVLF